MNDRHGNYYTSKKYGDLFSKLVINMYCCNVKPMYMYVHRNTTAMIIKLNI